ncbi:reverse transcriptase [Phytophthora megakarya]|uniref:Reverse transcriptase n=1 Tax=Phytophthora megakarya TaxID=4795 RepID=A0A225WEF0_9STRA|nr:reverse transcriptase [Phytophthora megakarya]
MDPSPVVEDQPGTSDLDLTLNSDPGYDECVYYHEGSDLYAEDVDGQMAVLPEVPVTTEDVRIEDIQLCDITTGYAGGFTTFEPTCMAHAIAVTGEFIDSV